MLSQIGFSRGDYFRFGLIFIRKSNKTKFFLRKKTETGSNRPSSVRFLEKKPVQNWFGSVFLVLARFFRFGSVFSVWLRFSLLAQFFFSISVRFGFFSFLLIKPKSNRTGQYFQNFNWFNYFYLFGFFSYFFLILSV